MTACGIADKDITGEYPGGIAKLELQGLFILLRLSTVTCTCKVFTLYLSRLKSRLCWQGCYYVRSGIILLLGWNDLISE